MAELFTSPRENNSYMFKHTCESNFVSVSLSWWFFYWWKRNMYQALVLHLDCLIFIFHTCLYRVSGYRCMWKSFWWMFQSSINQGRFSCTFTNLWIWWCVYILFVMLVTTEWSFHTSVATVDCVLFINCLNRMANSMWSNKCLIFVSCLDVNDVSQ